MPCPVVNGTSYITVKLCLQDLLKSCETFYKKLLKLNSDESEDATGRDSTLFNDALVLKLVVKDDSALREVFTQQKKDLVYRIKSHDWRSLVNECVTYSVDDLVEAVTVLADLDAPYQCWPNDIDPLQVYTLDPMGNVVGLTSSKNGMSTTKQNMSTAPTTALPSLVASRAQSYTDLTKNVPTGASYPSLPIGNAGANSQRKRCIAVLTSGGDAQGMNPFVRAVVRTALFKGCQPFAIFEGYKGLVRGGPEYIKALNWEDVDGWNAQGGTNIGTARCKEFKERAGRLAGALHLIEAGIDALIVCGGDGSLTGADLFRAEWPSLVDELLNSGKITAEQATTYQHLTICGAVGSIDNDMADTDSTIGAYSALDRICEAVDYVEATAKSHSRAFVIEVMGRHCGWLALMSGICTSADSIFIPEEAVDPKTWRDDMCKVVTKHRERGKRTTIVIVAEGALDSDLTPVTSEDVHKTLVDRLGLDTRITVLGHVQRGGSAVAFDRILATLQGVESVNAVLESTPSTPSPIITVSENQIQRKSLVESVKSTKSIAAAIKEKEFSRVLQLRNSEFVEHYENYLAINAADHYAPQLPKKDRLKIAIVNVGAPAGGINSAVYSMTAFCLSQGHKPYAIYNGWSGLTRHESVRTLTWKNVLGWESSGGSELGTDRDIPSSTDIGMIAYYFEKYQFDGLIIVGGFEGFVSLYELERVRDVYPAFRIPMVLIPATLSNNVPGTEYSLGSDTALNSLIKYCDVIEQSASSTKDRAFIVDCQGGNSGYLATCTHIAVGAHASYVPEEGITLDQLKQDITNIAEAFDYSDGREGQLILKTTNASKAFSATALADVMTAEAEGKFSVKSAFPGHIQQGGKPSPIDRTRATRFTIRAVKFIEEKQTVSCTARDSVTEVNYNPLDKANTSTAVVLGVKNAKVVFSPIKSVYEKETDVKKRIPKVIHWTPLRSIADHLSGRKKVHS
ncbi:uncharacterized protein KNAG_0D00570 [Huiozyma naganishii CBS 8797]|uniref:ATP-dependent 6-phosphofructokinase n=1 Tax=Huiozyma naganishii (strain ATCC MYA-139 / BCRC 22969 / CBS 8797 / KCTC 17520 / NBRC 10181 / NCYC 3082 / Yp74L-3) TaxID=1071383 RepID=J7S5E7_HUIN7|nr:hypothetical protein KNAG_0D00570 [Kazachstania naganishii CBS 8797]CCK69809.1 hypothetical protein KNAG_0D00570 [Kazachstania naganishii CBS 8797]